MITIRFNRLNLNPKDRILDIGCGEGRHIIKSAQQDRCICIGADYGFLNVKKPGRNWTSMKRSMTCPAKALTCAVPILPV